MQVDSKGFPMRDDLKEHRQIIRVLYDGVFYMKGTKMVKGVKCESKKASVSSKRFKKRSATASRSTY